MRMKIPRNAIARAVESVLELGCRKATVYLNELTVVKATALHRPDKRERSVTTLVTVGKPNFLERRFIRVCRKSDEPLPVRKVQLKFWPKK